MGGYPVKVRCSWLGQVIKPCIRVRFFFFFSLFFFVIARLGVLVVFPCSVCSGRSCGVVDTEEGGRIFHIRAGNRIEEDTDMYIWVLEA